MTLTPTKDEAATVWWQASKRFFDGVDDIDPPTFQVQDGDRPRHQDPSDCPPDFSPFRDQGGENFPRSPSPTRPTKMPRIHSSPLSTRSNRVTSAYNVAHDLQGELDSLRAIVSPLQKDVIELQSLREEVLSLKEKVSALEPLRDQVLSLKEKVSALEPLQDQVLSLKEEVSALRTLHGQVKKTILIY
jgi:prefoldin subunit 5